MIIGPFINGAAIILGTLGGAFISHHMPERLRTGMPLAFGVSSMAMGVVLISHVAHMPVMVVATVLGALIGELIRIEDGLALIGGLAKRLVEKVATTPRGISHEHLAGEWLKDVAPSTALREWFDHRPERWAGFVERYRAELDANPVVVGQLHAYAKEGTLTLVHAARDERHNDALVLRDYLLGRRTRC